MIATLVAWAADLCSGFGRGLRVEGFRACYFRLGWKGALEEELLMSFGTNQNEQGFRHVGKVNGINWIFSGFVLRDG